MANLNFNQISTLMTGLYREATGQETTIAENDSASFMSAATMTYRLGYDKIMGALTNMLTKTMFVNRPYKAKFELLSADAQKWGAITRKLSIIDGDIDNDPHYELEDGVSMDMYVIKLPKPVQFNFYGSNVFMKQITIMTDQIDTAFRGPDEFGEFMSMVFGNHADVIAQCIENVRRGTVGNAIAALKAHGNAEQVVHLLTEYNTATGLSMTKQTILQQTNFVPFCAWLYSRIETLRLRMAERSLLYHMNVDGKPLMKHSDKARQKFCVYAPDQYMIDAISASATRHPDYIPFAGTEYVAYWQNINDPEKIKAKAAYLNTSDGSILTDDVATEVNNVFGIIFDDEFMGTTTINTRVATTPLNAVGLYYNQFDHFTERYWTDFTEDAVVLLLD